MRWLAGIATLAAVALAASAHARPGRVVRVERRSAANRRPPQVYSMQSTTHLATYGRKPVVGSDVTLLNGDGVLGLARITSVEPRLGACQADLWDVEFEARWFGHEPGIVYTTFGVQGLDLADTARTVDNRNLKPPSGNPRETVWIGIDRGADDIADIIVTAYPCEDSESPHPTRPQADAPTCVDIFQRADRAPFDETWTRAAHDIFYLCR